MSILSKCILSLLLITSNCFAYDALTYQENYALENPPTMQNIKAQKINNEITVLVNIDNEDVDFLLKQKPIILMDGSVRQYTYSCISELHPDIRCSVTLYPNGDIWSLITVWNNITRICEGVDDGVSVCFTSNDITSLHNLSDVVLQPNQKQGKEAKIIFERKVRRKRVIDRSQMVYDNNDFGYSVNYSEAKQRASALRIVQLRITYDKKYLEGLSDSGQATIRQADAYTMMLLNHMDTIYTNQAGIVFQMYPDSRMPESGSVNGNYGDTDDYINILNLFTEDTRRTGDDLNILFSGADFSDGVIGVAWLGGACNRLYNNALLTPLDLSGGIFIRVTLFAHEVGHSFSCDHIEDPSLIMNPYITDSQLFGQNCRDSISSHINNVEENTDDWYYPNCLEKQNADCNNNGVRSTNYYGDDICVCLPGYHGKECEIPPLLDSNGINACELYIKPCNDNGNCKNINVGNGATTPECICFDGYTGYNCGTATYDACYSSPCVYGGACQAKQDGTFKCKCVMGRTGDRCERDINECASNPCFVGRCSNRHNMWVCSCPTGWSGITCRDRT